MNEGIIKILIFMFSKKIIGHKHFPEDFMIKSRIKNLPKDIQKEFYKEYHGLINKDYLWRIKKRTGHGTEWHISINPEYISELKEMIGEIDEDSDGTIL
jgi:hypothetical protein